MDHGVMEQLRLEGTFTDHVVQPPKDDSTAFVPHRYI